MRDRGAVSAPAPDPGAVSAAGRDPRPASASPRISARGLAVAYGAAPAALRDVTFDLEPGSRLGVLGPNAGGKTTLFRALLGELGPVAGTLEVVGRCGTVPQTDRSRLDFPVTARDVALMGAIGARPWWRPPGAEARRRALEALDAVGMAPFAGSSFGELSGGQRQRVLVARALVQDAAIVLFDEPFTGLDAPSAAQLSELIDRLAADGRIVLIATHDVHQTLAWDLVLCVNRRQVAFGPPGPTLSAEVLAQTYGASLLRVPGSEGDVGLVTADHHHG